MTTLPSFLVRASLKSRYLTAFIFCEFVKSYYLCGSFVKVRGHYGAPPCRGPSGTPVFLWIDVNYAVSIVNQGVHIILPRRRKKLPRSGVLLTTRQRNMAYWQKTTPRRQGMMHPMRIWLPTRPNLYTLFCTWSWIYISAVSLRIVIFVVAKNDFL